jgi:hypothetical protein
LTLGFAILAAACGGPTGSVAPSASLPGAPSTQATMAAPSTTAIDTPPVTPLPSATVNPSPEMVVPRDYPERAFVNRFVMRVAVSDLNVRDEPTTAAKSNGKAPKDGLFMMDDWPIRANGYTWYWGFTLLTPEPGVVPDLPTPISTGYDEVLSGWMATGTEDSPFLLPVAPRCATVRDLRNLAAMLPYEQVNCFASDSLVVEGPYRGDVCRGDAPGMYEPAWLASPFECSRLDLNVEDALPLYLHLPPGGPAFPAEGVNIRVRGHFSDDRSTTCRITELGVTGKVDLSIADAAAEQWCRGKFVVESYEVIG